MGHPTWPLYDIVITTPRVWQLHGGVLEPILATVADGTRFEVPEGEAEFVKTRQMDPNEKGFVGYETIWEPFQKEVEYETPKRP